MESIKSNDRVLSGNITVNLGDEVFSVDLSADSANKVKKEIYEYISRKNKDTQLSVALISHDLYKLQRQIRTIKYIFGGVLLILFMTYIF